MNSLSFKTIRYKNILSVGNSFMEVTLDEYKRTLITGKNGSAKSTILEAVFYALFDQPFRRIRMGQLINSTNNRNLVVEIELQRGADEVLIRRGQKPSVFDIIVNGDEWDQSGSKKDTQERLEKYLGINAVSFRQVVVLGTAGYKPFMELTTPERRKLVDDILDLTAIADMDRLNKDSIRNLNQEFNLSTVKIDNLNSKKESLTKINETQKKNLEEANSKIQTQIDELTNRISIQRDEIKVAKEECDSIELFDYDINEFRDKRDKIKEAVSKATHDIDEIKKKIRLHELGKCPTCEAEMDQAHINDLVPMQQEQEVRLDRLNKALQTIEKEYNEYIRNKQLKEQAEDKLNKLIQSYKEISVRVEYLKGSFNDMPEAVDTTDEIIKCEQELVVLNAEKVSLIEEKFNRGVLTDLLKDSGIKAKVVSYYVPYLNQRINHYLGLLDADYNFTLDSEFNESIKSVGRESFSYHSFSQGEKARIDISMLFSWRDVAAKISGTSINILLLDELFDGSTDTDGKNSMMRILKSLDSNSVVISHAEQDPQDYHRHIQMTKVGRFSQKEETIN